MVIEGFPIPAAPDAGPRGAAPLGESDYLPVALGEHLRSLEEIQTAPSESTIRWEERERHSITLQGVTLMAVVFELPGSRAGLVLLELDGAGYRVVNTYGVQHERATLCDIWQARRMLGHLQVINDHK